MKTVIFSVICFFSLSIVPVYGQSSIAGKWKDDTGGGVILIYEENGQYFGQVIASDRPEENKKIQGKKIVVLKNFTQKNETQYCCGTIYQPKADRLINATLNLINSDTLKIDGRYMGFSRSRFWYRL